jgi:hypothetical protein
MCAIISSRLAEEPYFAGLDILHISAFGVVVRLRQEAGLRQQHAADRRCGGLASATYHIPPAPQPVGFGWSQNPGPALASADRIHVQVDAVGPPGSARSAKVGANVAARKR